MTAIHRSYLSSEGHASSPFLRFYNMAFSATKRRVKTYWFIQVILV